jgi:hypothetical protein
MRRHRPAVIATGLALALGLAVAGPAAGAPPAHVALKKLKVKATADDPTASGLVSSKWVTHQGLPDAGKSDHALVLKKLAPAATLGSAGGNVHGIKSALTLTELGFDVEAAGHCSAVSPRVEVTTTTGAVFRFGCSTGDVTAVLADRDGDLWNRVRFTDADAVAADGLSVWPGFGLVQAQSIRVVFDEGTDTTDPVTGTPVPGAGTVLLDNIDVNGKLMGKPGAGGPKASA